MVQERREAKGIITRLALSCAVLAILVGLVLLAPKSRTPSVSAANSNIEKVVAVGDASPAGGTFSDLTSGAPAAHLNGAGQVAFWGDTTVSAPSAQLGDGIFLASPTLGGYSVTKVAHVGDLTPLGGTFSGFGRSPSVNSSGRVAFVGTISGGAGDVGVFVASPANGAFDIAKVAVVGDATPVGGVFGSLGSWYDPSLSDDGKVAFSAPVAGGAAPQGVWLASPTMSGFQIDKVAFAGDASPAGGTFDNFGYASPVLNSAGQVAFVADISGGTANFGFFLASPALGGFSIAKVAAGGDGTPVGGTFNGFNGFGLNDSGQVALTGQVVGAATSGGVFVASASAVGFAISKVAVVGEVTPSGGNFSSFGSVFLTGSNELAFRALVSSASANDGVFVASPSAGGFTTGKVSVAGDDSPIGGTFSSFFNFPSGNGEGDVVFPALVTGGSATSGIFLASPATPSPTPTATTTSTPSTTPTPTSTPETVTLTPSPTPTATPTPTSTAATPSPTPTLTSPPAPTATSVPSATSTPTPRPTRPPRGDADCDGKVDAVDGLFVLRHLVGMPNQGNCTDEAGDVSCNGRIDAVDALLVLRYVAGLPNNLPAGCPPIG